MPGLNILRTILSDGRSLSGDVFERDGNELNDPGLYVDLKPWSYHFLEF